MNNEAKKYLLALARQTLVDYFQTGEKLSVDEKELPDKELTKPAATFVTLAKNGELRGCIGNLVAKKKMYEDVINNALMAGFGDPRFMPIKADELQNIKIEISILSKSQPYIYNSSNELLELIQAGKHGIILQLDYAQATFLPQVWDDITDKIKFLELLSQKAGLDADAWKNPQAEIFYYTVDKFSE